MAYPQVIHMDPLGETLVTHGVSKLAEASELSYHVVKFRWNWKQNNALSHLHLIELITLLHQNLMC